MNKYIISLSALTLLLGGSTYASAQDMASSPPEALGMPQVVAAVSPMDQGVTALQTEWARIKYQISDKDAQLAALKNLETQAQEIAARYPQNAEPKIWEAIIVSTDAGIVNGLSALGKVKQAKALLEDALKEDPNALQGSAHTSLGSLYYKVPGWPIAFGSNDKAEEQLKQALRINPDGIDPNYFYGDFLLEDGRYSEAKTYLEHALSAPARPGREVADEGRRGEIKADLAKIAQKQDDGSKSHYN